MSKRDQARASLALGGTSATVLSNGGWAGLAILVSIALVAKLAAKGRSGRLWPELPDLAVVLTHTALLAVVFWLAVLRQPPLPLLEVLLLYAMLFLVVCVLSPGTVFNEFLILLVSMLLAAGSAATAGGMRPLWVTVVYLIALCHALPVLTGRRLAGDTAVRVRLLGREKSWWRAPRYAVHHLALGGLLLGAGIYLVAPRFDTSMQF